MIALYNVKTARFGTIQVEAESLAEARTMAKRFKAGPKDVARAPREVRRCQACDSAPCCCSKERP